MRNIHIYLERIDRWVDELYNLHFANNVELSAEYISCDEKPIPFEEIEKWEFKSIKPKEEWGNPWGSAWFKFKGKVPKEFAGKKVGALIDTESEACLFKNGSPYAGLTNKIHWNLMSGKVFVPLFEKSDGNEDIDLLVETGANGLFGAGQEGYRFIQADIVTVDTKVIELYYDARVLRDLAKALPEKSIRRKKIIYGVNQAIDVWQGGQGKEQSLKLLKPILEKPANASAMTVYSIGHAHIDLAWLWPVRETRRKGGRTFSTVLRLLEEYPDYKFGASQPQLYEWVKNDYPDLYKEIKNRVNEGRWELQGGMWCEPDMNIPSGESLVRQCLYGKRFFKEEFGQDVRNLWLPDVFGYSAALPQILTKCGIDVFMTQKISWSETNKFPHHTFYWQGIDGSEILTHFLPTNDYNLSNLPQQFIESEERYAQSDVSNEFLNLYGIGDGGGGPSREQIELGLRQQNLEGVPKVKYAFADDFFKKIAEIPKEKLPKWVGELYLEFHRGTYTSQAKMKMFNRKLEQKLRNVEFLGAIFGVLDKEKMDEIWKNTLLNQFHDILPGSSIPWVYKDAYKMSADNLEKLKLIEKDILSEFVELKENSNKYIVFNSLSHDRNILVEVPVKGDNYTVEIGHDKRSINAQNGLLKTIIPVKSFGYNCFTIEEVDYTQSIDTEANVNTIENNIIRVEFAEDGTISSIIELESEREFLNGPANKLLLWEDRPNNWGAWDINHFYRDTEPQQARLIKRELSYVNQDVIEVTQHLKVSESAITQKISLVYGSPTILIENEVDWQEKDKMLRVHAETAVSQGRACYEIQYGALERPTHYNTSWDMAKFEVAGQRWADLRRDDFGLGIINDSKYGYSIHDNIIELNLLRAPQYPDNKADVGIQKFTYGYVPHLENYQIVRQEAHALNSPSIVESIKDYPEDHSGNFFKCNSEHIVLETIKPAEDRKGLILRLYESQGYAGKINLADVIPGCHEYLIAECNLIEEVDDIIDSTELEFKPFEIRTFKVR